MVIRSIPILAALCLLSPVPALGQSFDPAPEQSPSQTPACPADADRIQRAICEDADLAQAQAELQDAVARAQEPLSPEAKAAVAAGQESWLQRTHAACTGFDANRPVAAGAELDEDEMMCLRFRYRDRLPMFSFYVHKTGPYQFFAVESHATLPSPDGTESGWCAGEVCHEIVYPQIDSPRNEATGRWNRDMRAWAEEAGARRLAASAAPETTDFLVGGMIMHAQEDFISAERTSTWFAHGAEQASSEIEHVNRWMSTGQDLKAGDLFAANSGWEAKLKSRGLEQAASEYAELDWTATVERQATDPAFWSITPDNLLILFEHVDTGFAVAAAFTWSELKPYMVQPFPLQVDME